MSTAKDDVRNILERLPENATLEDIQYHLYVRQKLQNALEQVDAGETLSEEEVERRLAKWLDK